MNLKLIKIFNFFVVKLDAFTKTENEKNARCWKITKNVSIPRLIFDRKFLCISKWESSLLLESVYHKKLYKSPTKKGKSPAVNPWKSTFTVFENHPKCLIWVFEFWQFPPIFGPIKSDLSGNTIWPKASGFKNSPNWPFLAFLLNFCPLKL